MLINYVNYVNENYQIDNSLYSSFQNELQQMGFPHGDSGKSIKLLTYSNGGAQNYGNVQHFASFSVSANAEIALKVLLNILLPGVVYGMDLINLGLWGLIPGSTTYNYDWAISPYSANDIEVYREASIYHKTNFLGTFDRTLYCNVFRSPVTGVPMDVVKGSFFRFGDTLSYSLPVGAPLLGGASLSFSKENRFMFVPTVSSLCYKKGITSVTLGDYNYDFWNNGVDFSQIPFDGYKLALQISAYHLGNEDNALRWAKNCSPLTISGPATGATGSVYSVNTMNPVSWSTTDSQIATISSTGVLHKMGFGTFDVIATILIDNGKLQLRKTVTIPAPTFPGFPTYHLSKQDLTAPGVVLDTYPFTVTAQRQNSIGSEFYSYFTYYWGEKVGSSPISWTTSSSLTYNTSVPAFTQKTVYFKAYYNGQYSSTYSTTVKHMEIMDPVGLDGDGVLHFDDGEDGDGETLQVKGAVGENTYSYLIDGHCFVFDHVATSRELCQAMLQCGDLVARIKTLRPWGEEEILAVNYVRTDSETEEDVEGVILFFYDSE